MTLSTAMLKADLEFMIDDLPTVVTWKGSDYNCVVGDITSGDNVDIVGIEEAVTFSVVINKADFTTYPDTGELITIDSKSYRILGINDGPDGIARTLICGDDTQ